MKLAMKHNFVDQEHALISGMILGALMKGVEHSGELLIEPEVDSDGDYVPKINVRWYQGQRWYVLTITPALTDAEVRDSLVETLRDLT